jgi:hypothetical protein
MKRLIRSISLAFGLPRRWHINPAALQAPGLSKSIGRPAQDVPGCKNLSFSREP